MIVIATAMDDDVWINELLVSYRIDFNSLRVHAVAVVLDINVMVIEYFVQMAGQARADRTLAGIVHEQPVMSKALSRRFSKLVHSSISMELLGRVINVYLSLSEVVPVILAVQGFSNVYPGCGVTSSSSS